MRRSSSQVQIHVWRKSLKNKREDTHTEQLKTVTGVIDIGGANKNVTPVIMTPGSMPEKGDDRRNIPNPKVQAKGGHPAGSETAIWDLHAGRRGQITCSNSLKALTMV